MLRDIIRTCAHANLTEAPRCGSGQRIDTGYLLRIRHEPAQHRWAQLRLHLCILGCSLLKGGRPLVVRVRKALDGTLPNYETYLKGRT